MHILPPLVTVLFRSKGISLRQKTDVIQFGKMCLHDFCNVVDYEFYIMQALALGCSVSVCHLIMNKHR